MITQQFLEVRQP